VDWILRISKFKRPSQNKTTNKIDFQLKPDHPQMYVHSYDRMALTLTLWPWYSTLT